VAVRRLAGLRAVTADDKALFDIRDDGDEDKVGGIGLYRHSQRVEAGPARAHRRSGQYQGEQHAFPRGSSGRTGRMCGGRSTLPGTKLPTVPGELLDDRSCLQIPDRIPDHGAVPSASGGAATESQSALRGIMATKMHPRTQHAHESILGR
jgi:hypothetical protein